MDHTCSQDLEACFNTSQSNFTKTQKEVKQLSANASSINKTMHSSMEEIKQHLTTHLESVVSMLCTKMHIPTDNPLSDPPSDTKA
jgi:uncharacterized membrane-anchored protein YhcB (DUF1043 family)